VRRRLLVLAALAAAGLVLAAPAWPLSVHVRVEGLNAELFGSSEPLLTPYEGPLVAADGSVATLAKPTPLGALEAASRRAELYYRLKVLSFGPYVDRIGRYPAAGSSGWVYKVNNVSPPVGAADFRLKQGDRVLWYWARFGPTGGPDTLDLRRSGSGCFAAVAFDDAGKGAPARNVAFRVDGRAVRDGDGTLCPAAGWHDLRVTKAGAVRSRVVQPR
jgi:Domain of unknown function (DUF4430)